MSGYIDMHCHILPEVDDGAQSIEETVQMLRIAYREGIRCIIATPHHHPKRGMEHPERLRKKLTIVRREAKKIISCIFRKRNFFWAGCCRKIEIRSCAVDE